jgi:hypothetical protein
MYNLEATNKLQDGGTHFAVRRTRTGIIPSIPMDGIFASALVVTSDRRVFNELVCTGGHRNPATCGANQGSRQRVFFLSEGWVEREGG